MNVSSLRPRSKVSCPHLLWSKVILMLSTSDVQFWQPVFLNCTFLVSSSLPPFTVPFYLLLWFVCWGSQEAELTLLEQIYFCTCPQFSMFLSLVVPLSSTWQTVLISATSVKHLLSAHCSSKCLLLLLSTKIIDSSGVGEGGGLTSSAVLIELFLSYQLEYLIKIFSPFKLTTRDSVYMRKAGYRIDSFLVVTVF